MNLPTYLYLLSKPSLPLQRRLWAIFFVGMLPVFCFAHDSSNTDSIKINTENKITTEKKAKIFVVEGTIIFNLENTSSAEIISIPIQEEAKVRPVPKGEEKKEEPRVVMQQAKNEEKPQKSIVQPTSGKELTIVGSKNTFGISSPGNPLKKLPVYFTLNDSQESDIPFYTKIHKISSEKITSYLFFSNLTTRPPPYGVKTVYQLSEFS